MWRSIWKAKEVLTLGCRWSRDGSRINVMNEPWLRRGHEECLGGPQKQGAYNIIVKNLMLDNVKQWNMRVLHDMFDYAVVEEIV